MKKLKQKGTVPLLWYCEQVKFQGCSKIYDGLFYDPAKITFSLTIALNSFSTKVSI